MESLELALSHILVQQKGYTWYPAGDLFREPCLFKSHSGRGILIRMIRGDKHPALSELLDTSFAEVKEILQDHPYQSITVIHFFLYMQVPDSETIRALSLHERYEAAPDIAAHAAWFIMDQRTFSSNIPWFNRNLLPETAIQAAADLWKRSGTAENLQQEIETTVQQRYSEWTNVFVQQSSKAVISMLVIIIGMFLWMRTNGPAGSPDVLNYFGAKDNRMILQGEYWRFITPMFLHVSFLHLLVNAFALYSLREVEWIYGSYRFLFIYLIAGVAGNITSFTFSPTPAAGASGAIFGLLGALLYFGTQRREFFRRTMGGAVWSTLIINLILGFSIPQISNSGHIGGLIGGFLAAAAVSLPRQKMRWPQIAAGISLVIFLTANLLLGFAIWNSTM